MPIYSIGQANTKGNRRFRIDYESRTLTYKDSNNEYQFNIPYLKPNWEIILKELCIKATNEEIALLFSVSDKQVNITYDETLLDCFKDKYKPYTKNKFRYLGIDLNPNRIGISVYDTRKLETIYAEQFEFTSDDQNKRKNEISHICQSIAKLMMHYQVSRVGMEDLTIKSKNHNKGKKFNKQINFWIRTFIKEKIRSICNLMNTRCGAASEIARRCGYQSKEFYPKLLSKAELVHRWKEMADSVAINWVGLYEEFKSRHLVWRSPPCSSRSSEYGACGKRLLVHQKGVLV
jgi:hypothetical protein